MLMDNGSSAQNNSVARNVAKPQQVQGTRDLAFDLRMRLVRPAELIKIRGRDDLRFGDEL